MKPAVPVSDEKPARNEAAPRPDPPSRDPEDSGAEPTHQPPPVQGSEKPVTSDTSEDGLEQGQLPAQALEPGPGGPRLSRCASSFANTSNIVPRSERRGLFRRFALIPEIERPYEYKASTKWMITAIVALAAAAAPMGSGIFLRESQQRPLSHPNLPRLTEASSCPAFDIG